LKYIDSVIKSQYKSHKAWVPCVKWHPTNPLLFASASHDNTVKIWDHRSNLAMHTINSHTEKALCVAWQDENTLLSGGADTKLKVSQFTSLSSK
jgi:ribosome biogenesis protein